MKTILECTVGSTLHGTNVQDGLEDLDLMGVYIEPPDEKIGFNVKDVNVWRTKPEGVRSEVGDTDYAGYGLGKYLDLALRCNPTILLPLFAPSYMLRVCTQEGHQLRALAPSIVSRLAAPAFMGYMRRQQERLVGTRGQMNVTRPELVEKYGYDTKYAGHIVRLALQGIQLLTTGELKLPMPIEQRDWVIRVRTGQFKFEEFLRMADALEEDLKLAAEKSTLPSEPDRQKVENWMIKTYLDNWSV